MNNLKTADFFTLAEGETTEVVRRFALIPKGWKDRLSEHPADDEIYYWCDPKEWITLGAGEQLGGVEITACACGECDDPTEGDYY